MLIDVSEFNPDTEETRGNMILPEMLYRFAIGVASRYYGLYSNVSSRSTVSPTQALVPGSLMFSSNFEVVRSRSFVNRGSQHQPTFFRESL